MDQDKNESIFDDKIADHDIFQAVKSEKKPKMATILGIPTYRLLKNAAFDHDNIDDNNNYNKGREKRPILNFKVIVRSIKLQQQHHRTSGML